MCFCWKFIIYSYVLINDTVHHMGPHINIVAVELFTSDQVTSSCADGLWNSLKPCEIEMDLNVFQSEKTSLKALGEWFWLLLSLLKPSNKQNIDN